MAMMSCKEVERPTLSYRPRQFKRRQDPYPSPYACMCVRMLGSCLRYCIYTSHTHKHIHTHTHTYTHTYTHTCTHTCTHTHTHTHTHTYTHTHTHMHTRTCLVPLLSLSPVRFRIPSLLCLAFRSSLRSNRCACVRCLGCLMCRALATCASECFAMSVMHD